MLTNTEPVSVRVALRIRPSIVTENTARVIPKTCVQLLPDEPQIVIGREESTRKSFTYDFVYGTQSTQSEIYSNLAAPIVSQFLEGFNATILAYGQTFSGKTYTMGSNNDNTTLPEQVGIMPRVFHDIFALDKADDGTKHVLKVSFLEIYQEQDLLAPQTTAKEISVRETKDGTIVLSGITEKIVDSVESITECLITGGVLRTTGDTLMHSYSSRSHAIFTITLEKLSFVQQDPAFNNFSMEPVVVQRSKLHLVDLAGSERLKRTGAEGVRLKESVKINSGLLALGNVISILGDEKADSERSHVPYRDSKLTRLLQDSLGGNSQTLMLACISPLETDYEETLNTLKYAYRARKIKNKPIVNTVDQVALERTNMQNKIDQLEGRLKGLQDNCSLPSTLAPEMIDFDNEQWMQFFIDQLKMRTIRGTNAVKALEASTKENAELKKQIAAFSEKELDSHDNASNIKQEYGVLQNQVTSWKSTVHSLLGFCLKVIKGENPSPNDYTKVRDILQKHYPSEKLSERLESVPASMFPPIQQNGGTSTRAPSTNSTARSHRRKRLGSEDYHGKENTDEILLKPLETELRETRKYLAQMEKELSRTKTMLQQNEAISAESSKEISRLMDVNDTLWDKLQKANPNADLSNEREILSIKAFAEIGIQTGISIENHSVDKDVEAQFVSAEPHAPSEKLIEELSIATKAKVDLLKELSKANKESEKQRHQHADQVQKLEREIDSKENIISKMQDDLDEKDQAREKLKDELDRKIKLQESTIQKYKQKQKEMEKNLKWSGGGDQHYQRSQQEIERLTLQIQTLKKKLKEEHEKFNELESRKVKEVSILNKQIEEENKKARQLEVKVELFRKKLDRKSEETAALVKKTKDLTLSAQSTPKGHKFEKHVEHVVEHKVVEYDSMTIQELETVMSKERAELERLELELEKSSDEDVYTEQHELRSELILKISLIRSAIGKVHQSASSSLVNESKREWKREHFQDILDQFPSGDKMHYITSALENLETNDAKFLICDCLKEITEIRQSIKSLQSQEEFLQTQNQDLKDVNEQLEKRSQKIVRSYEKKMTALENKINEVALEKLNQVSEPEKIKEIVDADVQTEAVERFFDIDSSPQEKPEGLKDLEKDVFYYRNANKELKSKLREVVAVNHRLAKTLQERVKTAESNNEAPSFPVAVEIN